MSAHKKQFSKGFIRAPKYGAGFTPHCFDGQYQKMKQAHYINAVEEIR